MGGALLLNVARDGGRSAVDVLQLPVPASPGFLTVFLLVDKAGDEQPGVGT